MASSLPEDHYPRMVREFGWKVPRHFNMAQVCAARWAQGTAAAGRVAIIEHVDEDEQAMAELARVAAPGAALLISMPLHPALWTPFAISITAVLNWSFSSV